MKLMGKIVTSAVWGCEHCSFAKESLNPLYVPVIFDLGCFRVLTFQLLVAGKFFYTVKELNIVDQFAQNFACQFGKFSPPISASTLKNKGQCEKGIMVQYTLVGHICLYSYSSGWHSFVMGQREEAFVCNNSNTH